MHGAADEAEKQLNHSCCKLDPGAAKTWEHRLSGQCLSGTPDVLLQLLLLLPTSSCLHTWHLHPQLSASLAPSGRTRPQPGGRRARRPNPRRSSPAAGLRANPSARKELCRCSEPGTCNCCPLRAPTMSFPHSSTSMVSLHSGLTKSYCSSPLPAMPAAHTGAKALLAVRLKRCNFTRLAVEPV